MEKRKHRGESWCRKILFQY